MARRATTSSRRAGSWRATWSARGKSVAVALRAGPPAGARAGGRAPHPARGRAGPPGGPVGGSPPVLGRRRGRAFEKSGAVLGLVTALSLAAIVLATALYAGSERFFAAWPDGQGSFYAVLPHSVMAGLFGAVFAFAILALAMGFSRFWLDMGEEVREFPAAPPLSNASWDAMGLRYLDGGGEGCTYPDERASFARRTWHHFTFYGFLMCF